VDRRIIGSWLSGPRAAANAEGVDLGYPGQRLGLPESGPGSVASFGRRFTAILVDWLLCLFIAGGLLGDPNWTPVVFGAENLVLVGTLGYGVGGRLLGVRVTRLGGGYPSALAVLVRTALLCLAIPALIWDRDGRGLHDRAAGTVVVRAGQPAVDEPAVD
jgi:uncharacterized RDD family membrane protein YckC